MMNSAEISEVRNYLLSKNLSLDLLVEIEDHFLMQIEDVMQGKELDFSTAFKATKESWSSELRMVRKNRIGKLITSLENKLVYKNTIKVFMQSLFIGLLVTFSICFLAINFSYEIFGDLIIYQYPIGALLFATYFLFNIKFVLLGAKQRNIRVSIFKEGIIFNIFFPYLIMYLNIYFGNKSEVLYHLINTKNIEVINYLIFVFVFSMSVSFGTITFVNFLKSIKKNYQLIIKYDSL